MMKPPSSLFAYAHDGKQFYRAVMSRLSKFPDVTLNEFCDKAKIEFSTAWRWNKGSKPSVDTIVAVEKALTKLEKPQSTSSSAGINPTALL